MGFEAGERLGPYLIEGLLGAGGMGEVYRAYDGRLDRRIALKVLPSELASDSDRALRFHREAKAAAALNHPNIVTIHSIEEANGIPFLTMELVEGRTLAEVISAEGLPPAVVVRYAVGIADAVSAAHARGIIHRDLKPANVMVTPEGRAKVLDFGLAKVREPLPPSDGTTRLGTENLTGEGQFVGTVAYMSPEQLEGKAVDHRSDIFSLGVVLFEMATGRRPFQGDTQVSIITSILRDEPPPITDLCPVHPPALSRVIKKALQKDPSRRYQTAADLLTDLQERVLESGDHRTNPVPVAHRRIRSSLLLLAPAVVVAAGASLFFLQRQRHENKAVGVVRMERVTTDGQAERSTMSSDGRYVVHIKEGSGRPSIWLRHTATGSDVEIVPPADVFYNVLTMSQDDSYVYFASYPISGAGSSTAILYKIPVLGGQPQQVLINIDGGVAFSPSGEQLAFVRANPASGESELIIAAIDGRRERVLADVGGPNFERFFRVGVEPAWSPDGRTILMPAVTNATTEILSIDVQTGGVSSAGGWETVSAIEWMGDGRSYVVAGKQQSDGSSQIWHIDFPSHRPRRITNDLAEYVGVAIRDDGRVISTVQRAILTAIWVVDPANAQSIRQITTDRNSDGAHGVAWTADGRVAFTTSRSGPRSIWIMNADGSGARQLSVPYLSPWEPRVAPDGQIFFDGHDSGGRRIWQAALDGTAAQPVTPGPLDMSPVLTDDGSRLYFFTKNGTMVINRTPGASHQPTAVGKIVAPIAATNDGSLLGIGPAPEYQTALLEPNGKLRLLPSLPLLLHPLDPMHGLAALFADGGASVIFPNIKDGVSNLWLRTARGDTQITHFDRERIFGFDRSSSGRLVIARGHIQSDVVLLRME